MITIKNTFSVSILSLTLTAGLYAADAAAGPYADRLAPQKRAQVEKWVDSEFKDSSISRDQQIEELAWFIHTAEPYQGLELNVLSETIKTHEYESQVLARAFTELTGVKIHHELQPEGTVIDRLWVQFIGDQHRYDAFISDSDLIGNHSRSGRILALSDFMQGEGKDVTLPTLDINDFIGISFVTGLDGKIYQLPDQQFANLYWFRYDWFQRPDLKKKFKEIYGYELGVPINWSAYEDIADFFTNKVKNLDGKRVYGHMDYGKRDPSLGWRFTDAWFSMAGAGDPGLPNGKPVDEWGIRIEGCHPVGSSMDRGGATNSPAAVYSLEKYIDWLKKYAPPEAIKMDFTEAGSVPAQGHIAQQIFWYTAFTSDMTKPGLPVVNSDGTPKWRMAPSPRGAYWQEGMKLGYQDAGSWTIPKNMSPTRQKAVWLYAQFTVAKTVSLKKTLVGLTPIRESDLKSAAMQKAAPKLGGLVEFYLSPARKAWTPTGVNVPDYPKLSRYWWPTLADAITGKKTPQQALDSLAERQDRAMAVIQRNMELQSCAPKIADASEVKGAEYWLRQPGAPKPKLSNEKPKGVTASYDELLKAWKSGRVR
ncbi:ABC-type sugar transport system, periplasmic component [Hahella chejuensis KCTC 2396]|uniref:ABC-type sugar transport system, periplasmic component n=1 Tax=Hahella chejuensis (strain KCTC 2396) TaxID=349521 RepID=Q2SJ63_HAHCH|nr:ABC transporter substrate-binding protein [Hahella chejuensis]ABC29311.1 ABC-type sugar transport system, periplasmic component [Hahella chejuensis KCTC 2396]